MAKYYATTAIPYVNGAPHLGHALEFAQVDTLARWHRLLGDDTFFLTGTDENSQKLLKVAEADGVSVQEIADRYTARFQGLTEQLQLTNDGFLRTTDQTNHWPGAVALWEKLVAADLIYKGTYAGLYCIDCEQYYGESDLVDGKCPVHGTVPERIEEENYFFKLSKFQQELKQLIESDAYRITPATRRNEALAFLEQELADISFSRPAKKLAMGVPVPGDDSQRMYVWCDALANYITGIGYGRDEAQFKKYWPTDLHVIGKDIWKFHAVYWPAMLLGADLPVPKSLYIHGFFTIEGEKMSKSKGNVIDPFELVERHGADAVRYYLLRAMPHAGDGDYSARHFSEIYQAELANDFGNLVSRVLTQIEKGYEGKVPAGPADPELKEQVGQTHHEFGLLLDDCKFAEALERLNGLVSYTNKRIDRLKPWELEGPAKDTELYNLAQVVGHLAVLYAPVIPNKANDLLDRLGLQPDGWNRRTLLAWEKLPAGSQVRTGTPLFPKT